jgi:outer membrane PBP1 activator LpoA protein
VQQRVLQMLQSMDPLHISLLRERYRHPDLAGWISLAETLNATTPQYLESDLVNWRLVYPGHPVLREVLDQSIGSVQLTSYRQIALLLPLTSGYGSAAQAFYDGFVEAQSRDPAYLRPEVILYDIGEEPGLSSLYYQAAINDGADFVVGPLGRKASDSLLANLASETDTLVIADIPEGRGTRNLFSISLSPEDEARQVAHKAYSEGYRQATVFRIEGPWGQRVGAAFVSQWEQLGGIIVKNSSFPKTISDYTRIIQKLLGLDKSIARYRLLEAQTGVDLKFTPRRNEDMDFLFLAANYEQARQVVPQLRFFQAHDLPLYATSYVYSGKPEPAVDTDLDGLVFGDMKWMLDGVDLYREKIAEEAARKAAEKAEAEAAALAAQEAEALALAGDSGEGSESDATQTDGEEATVDTDGASGENTGTEQDPAVLEEGMLELDLVFEDELIMLDPVTGEPMVDDELELVTGITTPRRPYQDTRLDRLYALGLQSYQVIPRLNGLRGSSWNRYIGDAMTVSVDEGGAVIRHPVWSVFKSGLPEPIYRPGSLSLGLQQIQ